MNSYIVKLITLTLFFSFTSLAQANSKVLVSIDKTSQQSEKTVKLKITGITCAGCSNHVSMALEKVDGVLEQSVDYPGNIASVKYDESKTNPIEMIKAIEKAGYKAEIINETKSKK